MPTLPRRLNFSKEAIEAAPSVLWEHPAAQDEGQPTLMPKTRIRSRCSSILKRTASFHAATANLIARAVTKGGDRRCTVNRQEKSILSPILDLPESSEQTGPPKMVVPSSVAGTGLTTFLTTVSVCPSTRAILSSGDHDFGLRKSRNPLMALTPCASVMAMYSGMMGGFGESTESVFVYNTNAEHNQSSWLGLQSGQRWFWFVERWKSCIERLPIPNQATNDWNSQPGQGRVSPWLTIFQIFVIMFLSVMLYRNMEIIFGW